MGSVSTAVKESLEEIINRHQLELIEELTTFIDHLNKILTSCSSSSTKNEATFKERKTNHSLLEQQFTFRKVNSRLLVWLQLHSQIIVKLINSFVYNSGIAQDGILISKMKIPGTHTVYFSG